MTGKTLYRIGWLGRLPPRMPYPAQCAAIAGMLGRLPRETELVIDYSGVGRGVFDIFEFGGISPLGVTMTAGESVHWTGRTATVPKSLLVSRLVALMHSQQLVVHRELSDWPALRRELQNFRPENTASGLRTWNAAPGFHDDLVIATALAGWRLVGADMASFGLYELFRQTAGKGGMRYCMGVDLAQSCDRTAICVMSRIDLPSAGDEAAPEFTAAMELAPQPAEAAP